MKNDIFVYMFVVFRKLMPIWKLNIFIFLKNVLYQMKDHMNIYGNELGSHFICVLSGFMLIWMTVRTQGCGNLCFCDLSTSKMRDWSGFDVQIEWFAPCSPASYGNRLKVNESNDEYWMKRCRYCKQQNQWQRPREQNLLKDPSLSKCFQVLVQASNSSGCSNASRAEKQ